MRVHKESTLEKYRLIAQDARTSGDGYTEVARRWGVSYTTVQVACRLSGYKRGQGRYWKNRRPLESPAAPFVTPRHGCVTPQDHLHRPPA